MAEQSNQNPDISAAASEEEKEKIERMNRIRQSLANMDSPAAEQDADEQKPAKKPARTQSLDISVDDNPPPVLGSEETRNQKRAEIREALAMVERPKPAPQPQNAPTKLPPLKRKGSKSAMVKKATADTVVAPQVRPAQNPAAPKSAPQKTAPTQTAPAPKKLPPLKPASAAAKPVQSPKAAPAAKPQTAPKPKKEQATAQTAPKTVKKTKISAAPEKPAIAPKKLASILGGSLAGALVIAYLVVALAYSKQFLPNTYINETAVGGMTREEATDALLSKVKADDLVLVTPDGNKAEFEASGYNAYYSLPDTALDEAFSENRFLWLGKLFKGSDYTVKYDFNYSEEDLRGMIASYSWGNEPAKNAHIQRAADGMYEIVPATLGDKFDKNKLMEHIGEQLSIGKTIITMEDSGCYDAFAAEIQAEDLTDELELCNRFAKCTITYDYGDRSEVLEGVTIAEWVLLGDGGDIDFNRAEVETFVAGMASKYDTLGKDITFRSTLDGVITVPFTSTSLYGWQINQSATVEQLLELLRKGESATIEPVYRKEAPANVGTGFCRDAATDDIGHTYIEVDISAQHVWYYKGGVLQMDTDCVTGIDTNPDRRTPRGIFKLWSREKNRILGQMDDEGYETFVNYWMPINYTGVGLHDAVWQGAFGGTRYLTGNGSHGCINLPLSFAKDLYNATESGIPVIVHE